MNKAVFEASQQLCVDEKDPRAPAIKSMEFWLARARLYVGARDYESAVVALETAATFASMCVRRPK